MTLSKRLAIVASLPGSPLQIGARLGIAPAAIAEFLNDLRDSGHARKTNKGGFRLA